MTLTNVQIQLAAEEAASASRDGDKEKAKEIRGIVASESKGSVRERADFAAETLVADSKAIGEYGKHYTK